nr:transcriptional repressor [Actinomycetales bacterium]
MPTQDADLLRQSGLRATPGRLSVLEVLAREPHVDAETIRQRIGLEAPSLQAVHNILADLHSAGLVRRFVPARSAARYERRIGDNHHHAVCSGCGTVFDVDSTTGDEPYAPGAIPEGFRVSTAEIVFWGVCADCA